jgi:A/G-specific adenine glycosylase
MSSDTASLRADLLRWYDASARDLPWRKTRDPYAIWVSEVMLQQTRVETVLCYYDRFLARFPTPYALAAADEDAVMAAWSGLGYYRRARNLHAGVRDVCARYGGEVPADPEQRRALPGVGRYTAGAIGSIAFGREEPLVDGNVARVLSRLYAIDTPLPRGDTQRALWEHAARLVVGERPGALNQALMELGATLCAKQSPRCARCPVRAHCAARAGGREGALPVVPPKRAPRAVELVALVALVPARARGAEPSVVLARGEGSLFGGLWNLPACEGEGRAAARALCEQLGVRGELDARPAAAVEHVLTHRKLDVRLWRVDAAALASDAAGLRAVPLGGLSALGVSRLTHKALDALGLGAQRSLEGVRRTY